MMSEEQFWSVIDGTASSDVEQQADAVSARLATLSADDLLGYKRRFIEVVNRSNTFRHLGAAGVIMGSTSEDVFVSFRTWVVYQGREVYTAFVADPDSLAARGPTDDEQVGASEALEFLPEEVWATLSDKGFPDLDGPTVYDDPTGPQVDTAYGALAARFPALASAYLPDPPPKGSPTSDGPRPIRRR